VYLTYGRMMPSLTSVRDEGSFAEIKDMLPRMERIKNKDKDISKHFELHDQMFSTIFQAKAGDAWKQYMKANPAALDSVHDEESAAAACIGFLNYFDIEYFFDPERDDKKEEYDDLANHDREGLAYWVLLILLDDGEAEEDPD
jgi:hypothetical protein